MPREEKEPRLKTWRELDASTAPRFVFRKGLFIHLEFPVPLQSCEQSFYIVVFLVD